MWNTPVTSLELKTKICSSQAYRFLDDLASSLFNFTGTILLSLFFQTPDTQVFLVFEETTVFHTSSFSTCYCFCLKWFFLRLFNVNCSFPSFRFHLTCYLLRVNAPTIMPPPYPNLWVILLCGFILFRTLISIWYYLIVSCLCLLSCP